MTVKERFDKLLHSKGYASLYEFCKTNELDYGNMNRRVNGVKQKIEIAFAFKLANILELPIEQIIEVFYPDEYKENQRCCKK